MDNQNEAPRRQHTSNQESSSGIEAFSSFTSFSSPSLSSCSSSSSSSSSSFSVTSTRRESSILSAVLVGLNLTQFLEGFLSEGYETSVDFAEINTAKVEQICSRIGMQSGHTLRFCRWAREQHLRTDLAARTSHFREAAAEEGPAAPQQGSRLPHREEQPLTLMTRLESSMRCPITQEPMADPVNTPDGHSYERSAIEQWFNDGKNTSPITGKTLIHKNLVPAFALRNAIHEVFPEARERFEAAFEARMRSSFDTEGLTQLIIAVRDNRLGRIQELLLAGADVDQAYNGDGTTALFLAAEKGYVRAIGHLLGGGGDANKARTNDGATPLFVAAQEGHLGAVGLLLGGGADVNKARTNDGATPLFAAAQDGHVGVVGLLLGGGANVNMAQTDINATPLFVATQEGHTEVVGLLLGGGTDVNQATTDDGTAPLFLAAESGSLELTALLLGSGADVGQVRTDDGASPLLIAAQNGHVGVARLLLEAGANLEQGNSFGWSPLFVAAWGGNIGVVDLLLGAGANKKVAATAVHRGVAAGSTPLAIATDMGHSAVEAALRSSSDSRTWWEWALTSVVTAMGMAALAFAWITTRWRCSSRHWTESANSPGCQYA